MVTPLPQEGRLLASFSEPNPTQRDPQQCLGELLSPSGSAGSLLGSGALEKHSLCKKIARKHQPFSLAGKTRSLWASSCAQQNNEAHSFLLSFPQLLSATKPTKLAW